MIVIFCMTYFTNYKEKKVAYKYLDTYHSLILWTVLHESEMLW